MTNVLSRSLFLDSTFRSATDKAWDPLKTGFFLLGALFFAGCSLQAPGNYYPHQSVATASGLPDAPTADYDEPPRIISGGAPEFPLSARERHEFGTVIVACTVGIDGRSHDIQVEPTKLKSFPYPVTQAVRGWRWEPARKQGRPVPVRLKIPFHFNRFT